MSKSLQEERDWRRLLVPRTVAVVGVSSDGSKIGSQAFTALSKGGFPGQIFAVNPKYSTVMDANCYSTVQEVPATVDLVLIAVPAEVVPQSLKDTISSGAGAAIIFSAGFGEVGGTGALAQKELKDLANNGSCIVLGPNSMGLVYRPSRLFATYTSSLDQTPGPESGVGFIGQSGAVGVHLATLLKRRAIGTDVLVSTGNEAAFSVASVLTGIGPLLAESGVSSIGIYLEGCEDISLLAGAVSSLIEAGVQVACLVGGRTIPGRRSAASHTAAFATDIRVLSAVLSAAGAVVVASVDELADLCTAWHWRLDLGGRVGILATSGGQGTLAADAFVSNAVQVPELEARTASSIRSLIPIAGSGNPVDVTAVGLDEPEILISAGVELATDSNIDWLSLELGYFFDRIDRRPELVAAVKRLADRIDKPLAVTSIVDEETEMSVARSKILVVPATARLARLSHHQLKKERASRSISIEHSTFEGGSLDEASAGLSRLDEFESKHLLRSIGIPTPTAATASDLHEAVAAADRIGWPVALKLLMPALPHKSSMGVVKIGLSDPAQLAAAFATILLNLNKHLPHAKDGPVSVLVESMVQGIGLELLFGCRWLKTPFPNLVLGLGGSWTEAIDDTQLLTLPVRKADVAHGIQQLRAGPEIQRRLPPIMMETIIDTIVAISESELPLRGVAELEINPLFVDVDGSQVVALDAKALVLGNFQKTLET